ncbi:hypothetical protein [Palleronia pelagia]|uniref:DUF2946 domain-containing protein n=1 Tax=Palleronia pelagia TaxID=387096 RepID=A0A1H8BC88_9RHOB|nr:hypothetical protein [Palleronia pelagia]SEM80453.1 hypothetical protein SAMN04488011_101538 [Palleronia pelagia]
MTVVRAFLTRLTFALALLVLGIEPALARANSVDCMAPTVAVGTLSDAAHAAHHAGMHGADAALPDSDTQQTASGMCCIGTFGIATEILPSIATAASRLTMAEHDPMVAAGANLIDPTGLRRPPKA